MKMVVPHILIAGWTVVLASGDAFTAEGIPHRVRQATRGTKEVAAKVVRDVQHVLDSGPDTRVALNSSAFLGARTTGTGASAESAIAIGTDVSSSGTYAIGMGIQANASQSDAIAVGRNALATGVNSMYLGARP